MKALACQAHRFDLPSDAIYLNGARMSPQLKSVTKAGRKALLLKANPTQITMEHFFDRREQLKASIAQLIDCPQPEAIALIPSVSYGMASVAQAIPLRKGQEVLLIHDQFPSNVYCWREAAAQAGAKVIHVAPPKKLKAGRARKWNQRILAAISKKTAVVSMAVVHWADGSLFDVAAIGAAARSVGARFVIDGTQSIGALPFSVQNIRPDALVCAGYKWLMGPYGQGFAYFDQSLWAGRPIEQSWFNRYKSEDFQYLTNYRDAYRAGADRYSVGESSSFMHVPMLTRGVEQLMKWKPERVQAYCGVLLDGQLDQLRSAGCFIEEEGGRGHHLFGIYLPDHIAMDKVKERLLKRGIIVSYRGAAMRVSPHVYNRPSDIRSLVKAILKEG